METKRVKQPYELKDKRVIHLIHIDDYKSIPNGTVLTDIFGEDCIVGKDYIDLDTRGGYLAYGILDEVDGNK